MLIGLKIDLFTLQAVEETLPALLHLLQDYQVQASFFPALGPDPASRRGGLGGLLRRPPTLAERAAEALDRIPQAGHELGALPYDVALWREQVLTRDAHWTRAQMRRGLEAFAELYGQPPRAFAAPDFLLNADTPLLEAELGLDYAVDSRGLVPYFPVTAAGVSACPQLPVTLPRIEEILAAGESPEQVHQTLFMETQKPLLPGHLFSFTAGDPARVKVLERLLVMWMGSQRKVGPVRRLFEEARTGSLAHHQLGLMQGAGGEPGFAVQGDRVECTP